MPSHHKLLFNPQTLPLIKSASRTFYKVRISKELCVQDSYKTYVVIRLLINPFFESAIWCPDLHWVDPFVSSNILAWGVKPWFLGDYSALSINFCKISNRWLSLQNHMPHKLLFIKLQSYCTRLTFQSWDWNPGCWLRLLNRPSTSCNSWCKTCKISFGGSGQLGLRLRFVSEKNERRK